MRKMPNVLKAAIDAEKDEKANKDEFATLIETLEAEAASPNSSIADNAKRLLVIARKVA